MVNGSCFRQLVEQGEPGMSTLIVGLVQIYCGTGRPAQSEIIPRFNLCSHQARPSIFSPEPIAVTLSPTRGPQRPEKYSTLIRFQSYGRSAIPTRQRMPMM